MTRTPAYKPNRHLPWGELCWRAFIGVLLLGGPACESESSKLQRFQIAVAEGDQKTVASLLDTHPTWATQPLFPSQRTALHVAGSEAVAELILERGGDVKAKDSNGGTPLHTLNKGAIVTLLIGKRADINALDNDERSPLFTASNGSVVEALVRGGLSVHVPRKPLNLSDTPLRHAVEDGRVDTVRALIDLGADASILDYGKRTMLHVAAQQGNLEMATLLIDRGAWVDATDTYGATPLHHAVLNDRVEVVNLLLERGANPHAQLAGNVAVIDHAEAAHRVGPRPGGRAWGESDAGGHTPIKLAKSEAVRQRLRAAGATE